MTDGHGHYEANDELIQSQSAKLLEDYNVKVSLTQYGLYMLFILVVVKDYFVIPEHVVHCSTADLHSKVFALRAYKRRKGRKKTPKRNLLPLHYFEL